MSTPEDFDAVAEAISARHQSTYDQLEAGHLAARPEHDAREQAVAAAAYERFAARRRARADDAFLARKRANPSRRPTRPVRAPEEDA